MSSDPKTGPREIDLLKKRIEDLERRLESLENKAQNVHEGRVYSPGQRLVRSGSEAVPETPREGNIESHVGEYGMAWLGNIVLLTGVLFVTQFLQKNGQTAASVVLGYVLVTAIYVAGSYTRKSLPYLSRLFVYNGHLLLFILSLLLHAIPGTRIIGSDFLGYGIILAILAALFYLGYRNRSQVMVVMVWVMATITGISSNSTHLMLPLAVVVAGTSIWMAVREGWWTPAIISVVLVYFTFLIWITGNPIVSGTMAVITEHRHGYIYLFSCALIYSALALSPKSERFPDPFLNGTIILNGLGFSFILTLAVLSFFAQNYFVYFGLIAAFCVGYSIWLQARGDRKNFAAMYAIYGFMALSITIGGIYKFPLAFFLLSIESLLVVSMALWFRSRFIVIMNSLMFMGLLIAYLAVEGSRHSIDFSFAIVALITARILNWKKQRLEIRTELIRNISLLAGAGMLLYGLHKAVPAHLVTLSWGLSAVLFFVLSVVIHNRKYRWLSIFTMVLTAFHLFLVDLKNISFGYRIIALMFISIVSLGISIYYARRLKIRSEEQEADETKGSEA